MTRRKLRRRKKISEKLYSPDLSVQGRFFQCPNCGASMTAAPGEKRPCPKCGTLMLYSGVQSED